MKAHSRSGQRIRITRFAFGFVSICASIASVFIAPGPRGILGAGLALLMCAIALHDARYFIIPNVLSAAALALSLIHAAIDEPQMPVMAIGIAVLRGVTLGIAFLVIKLAYEWLRRRQGIGMGDIKLAAVAGVWLDWLAILSAVEIAVLAALSTYVLHQHLSKRPLRATSALPFGLYFAPAIWVGWCLQTTLFTP